MGACQELSVKGILCVRSPFS